MLSFAAAGLALARWPGWQRGPPDPAHRRGRLPRHRARLRVLRRHPPGLCSGQPRHQRPARRRPAGQLHRHRQQLFSVCRTGRKTRPDGHRLTGQKLLLFRWPCRSHRDHHRVCCHVHLARTLCGVGVWVCCFVCHHHGDASLVGVSEVGVRCLTIKQQH
jgi:hypothetical protein